jgi:hypothetical protein
MYKNYFKIAVRNLIKQKVYSVIDQHWWLVGRPSQLYSYFVIWFGHNDILFGSEAFGRIC